MEPLVVPVDWAGLRVRESIGSVRFVGLPAARQWVVTWVSWLVFRVPPCLGPGKANCLQPYCYPLLDYWYPLLD